jgi:hypothetical protein
MCHRMSILNLCRWVSSQFCDASVYMHHRIIYFYGACTQYMRHWIVIFLWRNWCSMRHRINLVEHALSDVPLNICLWIASFLVVMRGKHNALATKCYARTWPGDSRRSDLICLPLAPPHITPPLWPLDHGCALDIGPRRWEGSALCFEGFVLRL